MRQGKRWEKERIIFEEYEKRRAIEAKKEREKLLETRTLYAFDGEYPGNNFYQNHEECEKNFEQFLKVEPKNRKNGKSFRSSPTPERNLRDLESKQGVANLLTDPSIQEISEIRKKMLSKRPEDPRLAKLKLAEVRFCFFNFIEVLKDDDVDFKF